MPEDDLETGYTTGTYATATTKAGLLHLLRKTVPETVELDLPAGERASLKVERESTNGRRTTFSSLKDAGDDPDVTDGARVRTTVTLRDRGDVDFAGGPGVGTVTLPGLPVDVGEPAINPVPRSMMRNAVEAVRSSHSFRGGVRLKVDVENGRELAERTLNPRLGIKDGLSILGTTGIVEPYSHASYVASVEQGLDVAECNGLDEVVLSTGGRTEDAAREELNLPRLGFVQFAGFLHEALNHLLEKSFRRVHFYFMPGKFSKLAQGNLKLHSDDSSVDLDRLRRLLRRQPDFDSGLLEEISGLKTVNQVISKFTFSQKQSLIDTWLKRVPRVFRRVGSIGEESVRITVLDLSGERLGCLEWEP